MNIILVRIPEHTTLSDIAAFLEPVLKKGLFVRKGMIETIDIQIIYDGKTSVTEYHGLVRIDPDAAARRAIAKLNRKIINGKHIAVREYVLRNWHNDRRLRVKRVSPKFPDRRQIDRRRPDLRVSTKAGGKNHS